MVTYVVLATWTEQGVKSFRETTQRAEEFSTLVEKAGGRVRELLWTIGEYDIVSVVELPDDETFTALALQVSSLGNIRTRSLKAFDADGMAVVLQRAG